MAQRPIAWARRLLPVPGGPRKRASSWRSTKRAVARSKTRRRFSFGLKSKSKPSSEAFGSRKRAAWMRRGGRDEVHGGPALALGFEQPGLEGGRHAGEAELA